MVFAFHSEYVEHSKLYFYPYSEMMRVLTCVCLVESSSQDTVGIKVMFNYGAESNVCAIEQAMERELVPVPIRTDRQDMDHLCG